MSEPKHTPGPWEVKDADPTGLQSLLITFPILFTIQKGAEPVALANAPTARQTGKVAQANAELIADAPDRHDQILALVKYGWEVDKSSLYDEEAIEGWIWTEPDGTEHVAIGDWDKLPPWPDSARAAIAEAEGKPRPSSA